ncbi:hypothetical protein [Breoghania sp.]|uniref:hypothetical protein n=1 Tax=Breoghania sp. TaxID=2065378 RepID=UPI00261AC814|nr:hypothetical protein [Breoghania sp.]MDJ0930174.1 hypothetical protein [Breoghania sp.]
MASRLDAHQAAPQRSCVQVAVNVFAHGSLILGAVDNIDLEIGAFRIAGELHVQPAHLSGQGGDELAHHARAVAAGHVDHVKLHRAGEFLDLVRLPRPVFQTEYGQHEAVGQFLIAVTRRGDIRRVSDEGGGKCKKARNEGYPQAETTAMRARVAMRIRFFEEAPNRPLSDFYEISVRSPIMESAGAG